jgi:tetratricopeptide (TPR) repeat protein
MGNRIGAAILSVVALAAGLSGQARTKPKLPSAQEQYDNAFSAAIVAKSKGDYDTAERKFQEALKLSDKLTENAIDTRENLYFNIARFYSDAHRYGTAEDFFLRRVESVRKRVGPRRWEVAHALFEFCSLIGVAGDVEEADKYCRESAAILSDCRTDPAQAEKCTGLFFDVEGTLGAMYYLHQDYPKARPFFEEVVKQPVSIVRPMTMLACMRAYADLLFKTGHPVDGAVAAMHTAQYEVGHPDAVAALTKK